MRNESAPAPSQEFVLRPLARPRSQLHLSTRDMAVVGIDFGTQNTVIAHAVRGGVDIILNESSKRQNP